jgi:hypothetical protein
LLSLSKPCLGAASSTLVLLGLVDARALVVLAFARFAVEVLAVAGLRAGRS